MGLISNDSGDKFSYLIANLEQRVPYALDSLKIQCFSSPKLRTVAVFPYDPPFETKNFENKQIRLGIFVTEILGMNKSTKCTLYFPFVVSLFNFSNRNFFVEKRNIFLLIFFSFILP